MINEAEAKIVRGIWRRFVELKSTTALARELNRQGIIAKAWTTADGKFRPGRPITRQNLYKMLRLARLAPDVVEDIARGQQVVGVSLEFLMRNPLPDDWNAQRDVIGGRTTC